MRILHVTLDDGRRTECEDRARILETEFAITEYYKLKNRPIVKLQTTKLTCIRFSVRGTKPETNLQDIWHLRWRSTKQNFVKCAVMQPTNVKVAGPHEIIAISEELLKKKADKFSFNNFKFLSRAQETIP